MRNFRFLLPLVWGAFVCWATENLFDPNSMTYLIWVLCWPFLLGLLLCIASSVSPWGLSFRWYSIFPILLTAAYVVLKFKPLVEIPPAVINYLYGREGTILMMLFCGFFVTRTLICPRAE